MKASSRLLASAVSALALGLADRAVAQNSLAKESPFMPAPGAGAAVAAPNETLEFAGVVTVADKTRISLFDKALKKSRTIEVKETVDGITVLSYDSLREQVVIKIGGEQKLLTLRKSTSGGNASSPLMNAPNPAMNFNVPPPPAVNFVQKIQPPPPASAAPAVEAPVAAAPAVVPAKPEGPVTPPSIEKQEEEARMLVSDLLEIGMAQRKAYEEAQKKAAAEQNGQAPAPKPGS